MAGDPNQLARKRGPDGLHQPIYHRHGYTPRRLFLITTVQFVFATSQFSPDSVHCRRNSIFSTLP